MSPEQGPSGLTCRATAPTPTPARVVRGAAGGVAGGRASARLPARRLLVQLLKPRRPGVRARPGAAADPGGASAHGLWPRSHDPRSYLCPRR